MRAAAFVTCLCCLLAVGLGCESSSSRTADQWPMSRQELAGNSKPESHGEGVYRQYCMSCHGVDGRGNGGVTGADFLAANSPLTKGDAELLVSVRDGKVGTTATMPAHSPVLSEAQILEVIRYVRESFKPLAAP